MNTAEIEKNMTQRYPTIIEEIGRLIDICVEKAMFIVKNKNEWIANQDSRFAVYGKYISSLNATRILLYQSVDFLSKGNWQEIYNLNFSVGGQKNDFVYLLELNRQIMFASYLSFFSEFESSTGIIYRHLNNKGDHFATNYKGFIIDNLKLTTYHNLIDIMKFARNTIHNNGIHIPDNSTNDNISLNYKSLTVNFNKNKSVIIEWKEFLIIYEEIIELTDAIHKHSLIDNEKEIRDIVCDA